MSNIYQVGCVIFHLMERQFKRGGYSPPIFSTCNLNSNLRKGGTNGIDLACNQQMKDLYSSKLRELVMECMMREPHYRPSSTDLRTRTLGGLNMAKLAHKKIVGLDLLSIPMAGIPGDLRIHSDPSVGLYAEPALDGLIASILEPPAKCQR